MLFNLRLGRTRLVHEKKAVGGQGKNFLFELSPRGEKRRSKLVEGESTWVLRERWTRSEDGEDLIWRREEKKKDGRGVSSKGSR